MKNMIFLSKNFQFLEVKFSIYVYIMDPCKDKVQIPVKIRYEFVSV